MPKASPASQRHQKMVMTIKGFAARAVINGIGNGCLDLPPLDVNGAKFVVTLKPLVKQFNEGYRKDCTLTDTNGTLVCQCKERIVRKQNQRSGGNNGFEVKRKLNSVRLWANSDFYTIDENFECADIATDTTTNTVADITRSSDFEQPEMDKNFVIKTKEMDCIGGRTFKETKDENNEGNENKTRDKGNRVHFTERMRAHFLKSETNGNQNENNEINNFKDNNFYLEECTNRLTGGNEFSHIYRFFKSSRREENIEEPQKLQPTNTYRRGSLNPGAPEKSKTSEKLKKQTEAEKPRKPKKSVKTQLPEYSERKRKPRLLCACCVSSQKSDETQLSASRTLLHKSRGMDARGHEEVLATSSTVPDFCRDDCREFCRTVHNYPPDDGKPSAIHKTNDIGSSPKNNNNAADGRIGRLERQMEELQRDLAGIYKNLIPDKVNMRYNELDGRLKELNSIIRDLKKCCPYAVQNFPAESADRIESERLQNVQYYSTAKSFGTNNQPSEAEPPAPDKSRDNELVVAKGTHAGQRPKCERIHDSDESINQRMAMCFFGKMKERNSDYFTCDSREHLPESAQRPKLPPLIQTKRNYPKSKPKPKPLPKPILQSTPKMDLKSKLKHESKPESTQTSFSLLRDQSLSMRDEIEQTSMEDTFQSSCESSQMRSVQTSHPLKFSDTSQDEPWVMLSHKQCPNQGVERRGATSALAGDASYCRYCDNTAVPLVKRNLSEEVLQRIFERNRDDVEVALLIVLQPDGLYHINVSVMQTGEWICCLYASEYAIYEANEKSLFKRILTFFIMDGRNTSEQKKRILSQAFEFVEDDGGC